MDEAFKLHCYKARRLIDAALAAQDDGAPAAAFDALAEAELQVYKAALLTGVAAPKRRETGFWDWAIAATLFVVFAGMSASVLIGVLLRAHCGS